MEFTYHGLVRYGFGFSNPNHAATLFAMVLSFFWVFLFRGLGNPRVEAWVYFFFYLGTLSPSSALFFPGNAEPPDRHQ
jgi:hypothetical protein